MMWIRPSLRDAFKKETVVVDVLSPTPSLIGGEKCHFLKASLKTTYLLFILSIKRNNDAGVAACL